jgi:hypothetical protein
MQPKTNNRQALIDAIEVCEALEPRAYLKRFAKDPATFIFTRCRTYDPEARPDQRVARPMPRLNGVEETIRLWTEGESFNVPKSPRTLCTWTLAALSLWEWLFAPGTEGYIISDTDRKSREILERIVYMLEHLDDDEQVRVRPLIQAEPYADELHCVAVAGVKVRSKLVGLPQGPNAMRQFGGSFVWVDEAGIQPTFRKLMKALGTRGRRIICSGTMENTLWDERCGIDELRAFEGPELVIPGLPRNIQRVARGVHRWRTAENQVSLRVHYRSDPERDDPQWVARVLSKMGTSPGSPDWRREMEIDPDAFTGERVYEEWDERIHMGQVGPQTGSDWKQVACIDFGVTNPTAILLGSWNGYRLRVWAEHYAAGKPVSWHKDAIVDLLVKNLHEKIDERIFERAFWLTIPDVSSHLVLEYAQPPFPWPTMAMPGEMGLNDSRHCESRVKALLALNGVCCRQVVYQSPCPFCQKEVALEPGLKVDSNCRNLRVEFKTLRRAEAKEGLESVERSVKIPDHATDALKYLAAALGYMREAPEEKAKNMEPPIPEGRMRFKSGPKHSDSTALSSRYG